MLTNAQITQGKALLKKTEKSEALVATDRFALGRWAVEVCGPAVDGRPSKTAAAAAVSPEEAAEAIGFASQTLNEYRRVATQWGDAPTEGLSWSALRFLVSECKTAEARTGLILKARKESGAETPTVNQLRVAAGKNPEQNGKDAIEQARAEAKAQSDADNQKKLADALAKKEQEAEKREQQARLEERQKAEKSNKAEADRIRKEEQAKAAEATRKQREEDKKRIAELEQAAANAAKSNNFDISQLTDQQKFEIMTILQNDPDQAASWFKARDIERKRKAEYVEKQRKEQSAKREQDKLNKEKQEAIQRNRKDYEASPLYFFLNKVMPVVEELNTMLNTKQTNMDHLITSRMTTQDVISQTESGEATMERMREAIYILNATLAMENLAE